MEQTQRGARIGQVIRSGGHAIARRMLKNVKHEMFVRHYVKHGNAAEAYRRAGYRAATPHVASANAARLIACDSIIRRVREVRKAMISRSDITLDKLLSALETDRQLARQNRQIAASINASAMQARLCGLLIDKRESGLPGDFTRMQTAQEIVEQVRVEMGDAAADALQKILEPSAPAPTNEGSGSVN
jgi:phage terminase small subunit